MAALVQLAKDIDKMALKAEGDEKYAKTFSTTTALCALGGAVAAFVTGGAAIPFTVMASGQVCTVFGNLQSAVISYLKNSHLKKFIGRLEKILEKEKDMMEHLAESLKMNKNFLSFAGCAEEALQVLQGVYTLGTCGVHLKPESIEENMETVTQVVNRIHGVKTDVDDTGVDKAIEQVSSIKIPGLEDAFDPCVELLQQCSDNAWDGLIEVATGQVVPWCAIVAPKNLYDLYRDLCGSGNISDQLKSRKELAESLRKKAREFEGLGDSICKLQLEALKT